MANQDFNTKEEIELIKRYQQTKDPMTLQRLRRMFSGAISKAIMDAPTYGLDDRSVRQKAMIGFESAIRRYDASKGTAPTTKIIGDIKFHLQNENNRLNNKTRLLNEDTILQTHIHKAKTNLEMQGKDINSKNILDEVNKTRQSSKQIGTDMIDRLMRAERRELHGDRTMTEDSGEVLKWTDVNNADTEDTSEIFNKEQVRNRFHDAFSKLNDQEQGVIKDRYPELFGSKSTTGSKPISWNHIALNNNIASGYLAKKTHDGVINRIVNEVKSDDI